MMKYSTEEKAKYLEGWEAGGKGAWEYARSPDWGVGADCWDSSVSSSQVGYVYGVSPNLDGSYYGFRPARTTE
jgi:hypothetical protein